VMVAAGRGAACGILVRDAAALEALATADTLILDKTGTLTSGRPSVVAIAPAAGVADSDVLFLAGSIERHSEHPLATAIVEAATARGIRTLSPGDVTAVPGEGARGRVGSRAVLVGSATFLARSGVDMAAGGMPEIAGASQVLVAADGVHAGTIA